MWFLVKRNKFWQRLVACAEGPFTSVCIITRPTRRREAKKWTNLQTHCRQNLSKSSKGLFTWRWGTLGRWANPASHGRKIKRVYIQSYNPGVLLGWGFLRLLLRLQSGSLSIGVPSSRLEKDERLLLGNVCIYLWKRHALCYVVLVYARNRWLIRYEE